MLLAYLAPLPIMIATMGWGLDAGAIAAAASVAGLTLIAEPMSGMLFAASVAFPAWLLAAFAVTPLARYLPRGFPRFSPFPSIGAIVTLAAIIGMVGAAAVLSTIIVIYHGYAEGAQAVTPGARFDGGRRPRRRSGRRHGESLRRHACAHRPGGDRRLHPADALRQPLRRGSLGPTVAQTGEAVARSADLALASGAARPRRHRVRRGRLGSSPPRLRNISASSPAGSARLSPSRASRSPMRCRAASS